MLSPVTSHRRFLHQIPELDDQLPQTLMLVTGVLRGHRCEYFSPIQGGICAWFDYGREETVAFRADMDAVPVQEETGLPYSSRHPGQMHACGHDGHTAMALSLCQWLSELSEPLPRNVLVMFQPSGETTGGADRMCAAGLLDQYKVRRVFGLHLWPGIPAGQTASRPGALMARSNEIIVWANGRSARLSHPEEGVDAMIAASEFLRRSYAMMKKVPPPSLLVFGKMTAGKDRSSICGEALLEGSMRTYREEDYENIKSELDRIRRETGEETGCQMGVHLSGGYPAVWNDERLYEAVCRGLGPDAPAELSAPSLSAEDFSFYQQYVPGLFFFLGTGDTEELHSPKFDFDDERVLPAGVEFLKKLARLE